MQAAKPAPSSWQRKPTPASLSEKAKLALPELLGSEGAESIEGDGGAHGANVKEMEEPLA